MGPIPLLTVFALAAAWRLFYLMRAHAAGLTDPSSVDARAYWSWSEYILHHGWAPPAPFFLPPLYPYALAAIRSVGANGLMAVLSVQAIVGAAAVVLLAAATGKLAGRIAAYAVGGLLAINAPATFFDGLILSESLLFLAGSVLVWFVVRTEWRGADARRVAGYGALVGILSLGRASNSVLLLPGLILVQGHPRPSNRWRVAAAMVAAFALCVVPALFVNVRTSGEPIPLTYDLGFNLYVGNNAAADGAWVDVTEGTSFVALAGTSPVTGGALDGRAYAAWKEGARLTPGESSAYWTRRAVLFLLGSPKEVARLASRKLHLVWTAGSIPQTESLTAAGRLAGPVGLPVLGSFGVLAVLGLTGATLCARRGFPQRWLAWSLIWLSVAIVPFFVTDRIRHPLIPALAVCAGVAVSEAVRVARGGTGRERGGLILILACALAFVLIPIRPASASGRPTAELDSNDAEHLSRLLHEYEQAGRGADASRVRARLEAVPGGRGLLLSIDGSAAASRGDLDIAESRTRDALEAWPDLPSAWEGLVRIRIRQERLDAAEQALVEGRIAGIDRASADVYDAYLSARRGDVAEARRRLARMPSDTAPGDPVVRGLLDDARRAVGWQP